MSNNESAKKLSLPSSPLINLMQLHPVLPVSFPTFSELIGTATSADGLVSNEPERLFKALLGDPKPLMQNLLTCPAKYESGVAELLQQLISGSKAYSELSTSEKDLLDRAVYDYNRPNPTPQPPSPAPQSSEPPQVQGLEENEMNKTSEESPQDWQPFWWV